MAILLRILDIQWSFMISCSMIKKMIDFDHEFVSELFVLCFRMLNCFGKCGRVIGCKPIEKCDVLKISKMPPQMSLLSNRLNQYFG